MAGFDFYLYAALAYWVLSLWAIFRAGKFQWFWAAVILWLAVGILGAQLLPGLWGITHAGPLFIPHFYLTVASVFFFIEHWQKTDKGLWQADGKHPFLSLFAVTNMLMTSVFTVLCLVVWYAYPSGMSVFAFGALLDFYALRPASWFVLQWVLMAVFCVHRIRIMKQTPSLFSRRQLEIGFFWVMVLQVAVLVRSITEGRF